MQEEKETKTSSDQVADSVKKTLQEILEKMEFEAEVEVMLATSEQISLDIQADDLGLLIGNEGETLNALQSLLRVITSQANPERIPILLDAEGYRERRAQSLRERAFQVKEKVKSTGQEAVMHGLTAYERRIIHLALAEDPDVVTYSEGDGPDRSLIVSPA